MKNRYEIKVEIKCLDERFIGKDEKEKIRENLCYIFGFNTSGMLDKQIEDELYELFTSVRNVLSK